ncbi:hypothetical protein HY468_00745 [Candidatus Roizmanbacteria bacterium]|nr:hypothetical protein [Candidatus Roizmanbacteria bacterium]
MAERVLGIDIDNTLARATDMMPTLAGIYNELLNLGMTPDEIEAARHYQRTFEIPQIRAFIQRGEDQRTLYYDARKEISANPHIYLDLESLPLAQEGVRQFIEQFGGPVFFAGYWTVRSQANAPATGQWLNNHRYPHPERLTACESPKDKLLRLARLTIHHNQYFTTPPGLLLIDDSADALGEAAIQLTLHDQFETRARRSGLLPGDYPIKELFRKSLVVGFGKDEKTTVYPAARLRIVSLPDWNPDTLAHVIPFIQTELGKPNDNRLDT